MSEKKKLIRNSTAEFLIFTGQAGVKSIEARYEDGTVWLTQKLTRLPQFGAAEIYFQDFSDQFREGLNVFSMV